MNIEAYDMFISHANEDRNVAEAICNFLEERKMRCFITPRNIQVGRNYAECIINGLKASKVMVVVLSEHSNKCDHMLCEVECAFKNKSYILPFRITNMATTSTMEYFLGCYCIDAFENNSENYFNILYSNCMRLLAR